MDDSEQELDRREDQEEVASERTDRNLPEVFRDLKPEDIPEGYGEFWAGHGTRYGPGKSHELGSSQLPERAPLPVNPPFFFREVTGRLGFDPPGRPPGPPELPRNLVSQSGDASSVFWVPDLGEVDRELVSLDHLLTAEELEPELDIDEIEKRNEIEPEISLTPDSIAYYLPWHLGGDEYWGIYFRRSKMQGYIGRIQRQFGSSTLRAMVIEQVFWHEMEHFEQEKAATALEDLLGKVIYLQWLRERDGRSVRLSNRDTGRKEEVYKIQEALATAREIEWAETGERKGTLPAGYKAFMERDSRKKSSGYRSFYLCLGEEAKQEGRAAFLESVGSIAQPPIPYRLTWETAKRLFGTRTSKRNAVPIYLVDH